MKVGEKEILIKFFIKKWVIQIQSITTIIVYKYWGRVGIEYISNQCKSFIKINLFQRKKFLSILSSKLNCIEYK